MNKCTKCDSEIELQHKKDKSTGMWESYWFCDICDRVTDVNHVSEDSISITGSSQTIPICGLDFNHITEPPDFGESAIDSILNNPELAKKLKKALEGA